MVARTLAAAPILAESLVKRLGGSRSAHISPSPAGAKNAHTESVSPSSEKIENISGDEVAAGVWADLWPMERQRQREFFCFGMDVLLKVRPGKAI
jgi:lycopene beta-cyclase